MKVIDKAFKLLYTPVLKVFVAVNDDDWLNYFFLIVIAIGVRKYGFLFLDAQIRFENRHLSKPNNRILTS
jgi:hypothetical protein